MKAETAVKWMLLLPLVLLKPSCAFVFYNYRGYYNATYTIDNQGDPVKAKEKATGLINRLAAGSRLSRQMKYPGSDTLYYYGLDYHRFKFWLEQQKDSTRIKIRYSGFHGFRRNPPYKSFFKSLADSIRLNFIVTFSEIKEVSNERIRK